MKTLNSIYLLLFLLTFVVAIIQCVRWLFVGMVGLEYMFVFMPMLACVLAYMLTWKFPMVAVHLLVAPLWISGFTIWGLATQDAEDRLMAASEVTDLRRYEELIDGYWSGIPRLVSHFPTPIPDDAKLVQLSHLPVIGEGKAHIQLRYSTSATNIAKLYDQFAMWKTKSYLGGDYDDHMDMLGGMPTTFFHTGDHDGQPFPDDFEIMVFDPVRDDDDNEEDWPTYEDRTESHGVAISRRRHEIIYWAEWWR